MNDKQKRLGCFSSLLFAAVSLLSHPPQLVPRLFFTPLTVLTDLPTSSLPETPLSPTMRKPTRSPPEGNAASARPVVVPSPVCTSTIASWLPSGMVTAAPHARPRPTASAWLCAPPWNRLFLHRPSLLRLPPTCFLSGSEQALLSLILNENKGAQIKTKEFF